MSQPTTRIPQQRGPLTPWVRGSENDDMSRMVQDGRESLMQTAKDVERFVTENETAICITGMVLGTVLDRRFYLLPLAVAGLKWYRSSQQS